MSACRRSRRSEEKPTDSGLTTVRSTVDELEGELDLAGVAGGFADLAEAGAVEDVGGQAHVDDVEEVEEL
jgi:hypothetical protein